MGYSRLKEILVSFEIILVMVFPLGFPTQSRGAGQLPPHQLRIDRKDTLSEALDRLFPNRQWRLWGKRGAIATIAKLNPEVHDINQLYPGMILDIGDYAAEMQETQDITPQVSPLAKEPLIHRTLASEPQVQTSPSPVASSPVPTTVAAPVSNHNQNENNGEKFGSFSVMPVFSYSKINATDKSDGASASYASDLNSGLIFTWAQHWSSHFQTQLELGVFREVFEAPTDFTLNGSSTTTSQTLTDIGAGAKWVPFEGNKDFALDLGLYFKQELFTNAASLTSINLTPVAIPELSLGARYRVLDASPFAITVHAEEVFLFPSSTEDLNVESGKATSGGLTLSENFSKTLQMTGDFTYSSQSQDSSIAKQNRKDLTLMLGVTFRFDAFSNSEELKRSDLP